MRVKSHIFVVLRLFKKRLRRDAYRGCMKKQISNRLKDELENASGSSHSSLEALTSGCGAAKVPSFVKASEIEYIQ